MMKRKIIAVVAAMMLAFGTPTASAAKLTVGSITVEASPCEIDEYFGRFAAWYYGVKFEGGALCG